MGEYEIRPAEQADLERVMEIYAIARRFMMDNGNPDQWKDGYPSRDLLEQDLAQKHLYVVANSTGIHGVFCFVIGPDPTYGIIEDGAWHSEKTYGTIHRIAGDGSGGIFGACLGFCREKIDYLRIDTHRDNRPMRHLVEKAGFRRCGIIHVADGSPRIAYDRINREG